MALHLTNFYREMRTWRHDIHKHPELGFNETRTAAKIDQLLRSLGIESIKGVGGTGVVGLIKKGRSSRSVGLRADMDALPIQEGGDRSYKSIHDGVFHGCGHDGHTAMLLGAAKALVENDEFSGTVYLVFQPSEENGKGALAMIDDGLFDKFPMDAIYGMHNMPGIPIGHFAVRSGQMMTFEDNFEITVEGKGGHASMPHRVTDPLVVGAEIVMALQTIVSRSVGPDEWAVVSVTEFITDGARNVIPSSVTIRGDARGLSGSVQQKIEKRMTSIVDGVCASYDVFGTVDYSHQFVVLVNTEEETAAAVDAAIATVGADSVEADCTTCTCSEDFAQFLKYVPGCFMLIGNGDDEADYPLHNPFYDFKEEILEIGSSYWVNLVRQQLSCK